MMTATQGIIKLDSFASINAQAPAETVSSKYSFVPTTEVVDALAHKNWFPVKATQSRTRIEKHEGFQKHTIRFRNPDLGSLTTKDSVFPEIVLGNAHNALSSFCLMAGLFRLVCTNGLIVSEGFVDTVRVKHIGYTRDAVFNAIDYITDKLPAVTGAVNQFQQIELTPDEQNIYAMSALHLKYDEEVIDKGQFNISRLLAPVRLDDKPPTLWNTFNTVQEKFIKGGRFKVNDKDNHKRTINKARGINSIDENIRVNKALWVLTQRMAEIKVGG
jgi:hypothetical protein